MNDGKKSVDFYHTIIDWKQNTNVIEPAETDSTSDNDNNDYGYIGYNSGYNDIEAEPASVSASGWFGSFFPFIL